MPRKAKTEPTLTDVMSVLTDLVSRVGHLEDADSDEIGVKVVAEDKPRKAKSGGRQRKAAKASAARTKRKGKGRKDGPNVFRTYAIEASGWDALHDEDPIIPGDVIEYVKGSTWKVVKVTCNPAGDLTEVQATKVAAAS